MATSTFAEFQKISTSEYQAFPSLAIEDHHQRINLKNARLYMRAPRIGFWQLLPPLAIAWIGNCKKTDVAILPAVIARTVQSIVLVSLMSMCSQTCPTQAFWRRNSRSRVLGYFSQALCILLLIDLMRLDPVEAQALVSANRWREETANLFRK